MQNKQFEIISDKNGYEHHLKEARRLVDLEIASLLPKLTDLALCERIAYILQTRGKRLRPVLVMLSA
jgi:geranylgeranyl pyrophosphate synthase